MIADAFWSHDYVSGIEALMTSLRPSLAENKQFLLMVKERVRIEHAHASQLAQLSQNPQLHMLPAAPAGGTRDGRAIQSSTLRSTLDLFTSETVNKAVMHTRIATDLEKLVREPLQKWCDMYASRIASCHSRLASLVAGYDNLLQAANKQRLVYYEHCHNYEDATAGGSPRDPIIKTIRMLRERLNTAPEEAARAGPPRRRKTYTVAGLDYTRPQLADLLHQILDDVTLTEYKVPLLGSYHDVTSGSSIATAARKHLRNDSFAYAEKFGQSLVDQGFLKPVGQISNRYQSTHNTHYQWQPSAFELIEDASDESDTSVTGDGASVTTASSHGSKQGTPADGASGTGAGASSAASLVSSTAGSTGTSATVRATDVSEEHYLQAVLELDVYRCDMEQEIMKIYDFIEKLEQDREEAIRTAMQDFTRLAFRIEDQLSMQLRLSAMGNKVNPQKDLAALVASHETGPFIPNITVFRDYFNGNIVQTYGVDIAQSKFVIPLFLGWISENPDVAGKVEWWTHPEPISEIYKLRAQINTGKPFNADAVFRFFTPHVVVSAFRQYLLELPESLVPFTIYERVKQLYSAEETPDCEAVATMFTQVSTDSRDALQQVIEYLRTAFPEEGAQAQLAKSLALPLVRPRAPSAMTMHDTHPAALVVDLLHRAPGIFEATRAKQAEIDASKQTRKPAVYNRSVTTPATPFFGVEPPSTPTPSSHRVLSNNTLRPLGLNMMPRLDPEASIGGSTDTTPIRGLGINAILPISGNTSSPKSQPDLSSPPRSPERLSERPPQSRTRSGGSSSPGLEIPKLRR